MLSMKHTPPLLLLAVASLAHAEHRTALVSVGEDFPLHGAPTHAGRAWRGKRIAGLLLKTPGILLHYSFATFATLA